MLRHLIERLFRGTSFRKRLPSTFASRPIYVSPDSALGHLKPWWDSSAMQLMSVANRFVLPNATVWDIGSNVGVFTLAAAHRAGMDSEVVAVEPDPFLAYLMQRTVMHGGNRDLRISVVCQAVSNSLGLARFVIAARGRSRNALEQSQRSVQGDGIRFVQYVPTTTLDSLHTQFSSPTFIKVDVEGAEALVLEGAEVVLSECRPILYIEVGNEQRDRVTTILKRHHYRLYDGDTSDGCELDFCPWNTLAVPAESALTNRGYTGPLQRTRSKDWRL